MVLMGPGLVNNKRRSCGVAGERLPTGSRRAESPRLAVYEAHTPHSRSTLFFHHPVSAGLKGGGDLLPLAPIFSITPSSPSGFRASRTTKLVLKKKKITPVISLLIP